ncbi:MULTISPECIES: ABC transporter permease [Catenuloplanes]|uniref:ABC transport system permease protein n=1 Tax=Catenuloplanes niger TaxID=587534 RepID=A0AAE3ZKP8_9ACTN|nr:FtsX-like permease family protein [Catenuloplanes niger]MDR7321637.1 putative ABC transport system permease protein [Catenuloplanes niger]
MAGRLLLLLRLLVRDLRRRKAETALLLVAIMTATATLTLALTLNELVTRPYERTRAATAGPDLVLEPPSTGTEALERLAPLTTRPGVTGFSGPYPLVFSTLGAHGMTARVVVQGRDAAPATVDQPAVTEGSWVRSGGVVMERAFADALAVSVGETVTIDGHELRVDGVAVSAARAPFPGADWHLPSDIATQKGGAVWVHRDDIPALAGGRPTAYALNLTIEDPRLGYEFLRLPSGEKDPSFRGWHIRPWQSFVDSGGRRNGPVFEALMVGSWLLTGLAVAGVAGIAGGRVIAQRRRVGLLKAVGAGPGMIAAVHLAEYLVIGLVSAGLGLVTGWLAAPVLFRPSVGLIGSVGTTPPPARLVLTVLIVAVTVALVATLGQVLRAAATDAVRALTDAATPPGRRPWRLRLSRRLPTPLLIGVRLHARRPGRARLVTANTLITTIALAAVLSHMVQAPELDDIGGMIIEDPAHTRLDGALSLLLGLACALALLNTVVNTWTTALDVRRPLAVARALGATPGQAGVALAVAQLLPAVPGVVFGIPAGMGLYRFFNEAYPAIYPPASWMVAVAAGVLSVIALLTAAPALAAAREPVADALR